jgi:hypothetical protein
MHIYKLKVFGCMKNSLWLELEYLLKSIFYLSNIDRRFPIKVKLFCTATHSILGLCITWCEVLNLMVYDSPGTCNICV